MEQYAGLVTPAGHVYHVDNLKYRIPVFDFATEEHLWIAVLIYKVNPEKMLTGDESLLDHESLLSVTGPGCYHCEQTYSPLLAKQPCKGPRP